MKDTYETSEFFQDVLNGIPIQHKAYLCSRIALRVLPFILNDSFSAALELNRNASTQTLGFFRTILTAYAISQQEKTHQIDSLCNALSTAIDALNVSARALNTSTNIAQTTTMCNSLKSIYSDFEHTTSNTVTMTYALAVLSTAGFGQQSDSCFEAVLLDVEYLKNRDNTLAIDIAPIWPDTSGAPSQYLECWILVRKHLDTSEWRAWRNIYDAMLNGKVLSARASQRLALMPNQLWDEGGDDLVLEIAKIITTTTFLDVTNVGESRYDVFISHASEDKESLVRPLARELVNFGYKVWFDEMTLRVGDSLRERIDDGLANSRFGIVILSEAFFSKAWPNYELNGLVTRELNGGKVILPIWHEIEQNDVLNYSPTLADKVAITTANTSIFDIATKLNEVLSQNN